MESTRQKNELLHKRSEEEKAVTPLRGNTPTRPKDTGQKKKFQPERQEKAVAAVRGDIKSACSQKALSSTENSPNVIKIYSMSPSSRKKEKNPL